MDTNHKTSILTIDDEEIIRLSIEAYLEDSGYSVIQAENGRVGLEVFDREKPDLVLVDLRMPEVDGLDVLAQVTKKSPHTPIIVVSGTGVLNDAIEALRLGAWDYVTKPIQDMAVLEHSVNKALERAELLKQQQSHKEELEKEVARRTSELLETNKRLANEVTERERAEEKIKQSLEEKEVLLKEIHHRVKNNLQIISSLLYLQSHQTKDEQTRTLLMESRGRVRSMALVHEKLYQSEDLARINYSEYLESFARSLVQTYMSGGPRIQLDIQMEEVFLPVDTAIPCSLIVNELMSNALKYAFNGRAQGTISIHLKKREKDILLTVSDDGVGFPKDIDYLNTDTLGMQLVVNLVNQLQGNLEVDFNEGSAFQINFSL